MVRAQRPSIDQIIDLAEGVNAGAVIKDRRAKRRVPYSGYVALLLVSPIGDRGRPMVLRARDISSGGISVVSRYMIYPGSRGALQLVRSDGYVALVGVQVTASRYLGNMQHHTGMEFVPLPPGITPQEFLDKQGRLVLMNPLLRENIEA